MAEPEHIADLALAPVPSNTTFSVEEEASAKEEADTAG